MAKIYVGEGEDVYPNTKFSGFLKRIFYAHIHQIAECCIIADLDVRGKHINCILLLLTKDFNSEINVNATDHKRNSVT